MEELKKWVDSLDPLITIVSLVVGLMGIALSFVFYLKSRSKKNVFAAVYTTKIIDKSNSVQKLKYYYENEEVFNLSITKYLFFNSGNTIIDNSDFTKDELIIEINDNDTIYDIDIVKVSDSSSNVRFSRLDKKSFKIFFDYLDPNAGFVLSFIHSSYKSSMFFKGKFKGINDIRYIVTFPISLKIISLLIFYCMLILSIGYLIYYKNPIHLFSITLSIFILVNVYKFKTVPKFFRDEFKSQF